MVSDDQRLRGLWYAPPLVDGDERPARVARVIERLWPGERMIHELAAIPGEPYEYRPVAHERDRDAWIAGEAREGSIPFVTNGAVTADRAITLSGVLEPELIASGGVPQLRVDIEVPGTSEFVARAEELAAGVASALGAHWGALTPSATQLLIARQVTPEGSAPEVPPGLPPLLPSTALAGPDLPHFLGWINVWSDATAAGLGVPAAGGDDDPSLRPRRVGGVWLARLTGEPLDLSRADHVEALQRAYARFAGLLPGCAQAKRTE